MKVRYFSILLIAVSIVGCRKNDDDPPKAAQLIFPEQNSECTEGVSINATESSLTFSWMKASHTNSYRLTITPMAGGQIQSYNTEATSLSVNLLKGVAYSWYVTSVSNKTPKTAISETWQFYNAGDGTTSYAPFPATAAYPASGTTVPPIAGHVTLQWVGADVDNDIAGYEVFLSTVTPPAISVGTTASQSLLVTTMSATIYYWRVVTTDGEGNTSNSEIFQFKTVN